MRNPLVARTLALLAAGATVTAGLAASGAQAITSPLSPSEPPESPSAVTDVRTTAAALVAPTTAQLAAVRELLAAAGPGARVSWDGRYGTPRTIRPAVGQALSGPRSGSAVAVARAWLTENRAMLGLTAADIAAMVVRRDHLLPGTGTRVVNLTQVFGGLAAARGGSAGIVVAADGRILGYTGSTSRGSALLGSFALSPEAAVGKVAATLAPVTTYTASLTGATRAGYQVVARGPFASESYVRKAALGTAGGGRAAYRVLFVKAQDEAYDVLVDAGSGRCCTGAAWSSTRGRSIRRAPCTGTTRARRVVGRPSGSRSAGPPSRRTAGSTRSV